MAYVAVDKDGSEWVHLYPPIKMTKAWGSLEYIGLPKGSIKRLIGRTLTWDDEPVELKEE